MNTVTVNVTGQNIEDNIVLGSNQERLKKLIASRVSNGSLVCSVLGDSTEAGVAAGGGVYAECNAEQFAGPYNAVAYKLITADKNFIPLDSTAHAIAKPFIANGVGGIEIPYDSYQPTKVLNPTIGFHAYQNVTPQKTSVTIYYIERTADTAAVFNFSVLDSDETTVLGTTSIDTYVAATVFPAVATVNVTGRLRKATISGIAASKKDIYIKLDTFTTADRGAGVSADGTAMIVGFAFGNGVEFHNFAVSSTTLTEASAANVSRGVDTSERLTKAQAVNSNMFIIGWGTNDSKVGVTTEIAFEAAYTALIASIRATEPKAIILMITDPRGAIASIYENNPVYNALIRKVAVANDCLLLDIEYMSDYLDASFYADDVHPSYEGVRAITESTNNLFGF